MDRSGPEWIGAVLVQKWTGVFQVSSLRDHVRSTSFALFPGKRDHTAVKIPNQALPTQMSLSISLGNKTYTAPVVTVCFKGVKGGNQCIAVPVEFERTSDGGIVESASEKTIPEIIKEAWQARFQSEDAPTHEIDTVYASTAATLANQFKIIDIKEENIVMELHHEAHGPLPTKPLWLNVEVVNAKIARARAAAVDEKLRALLVEANMDNIACKYADFARLLGKQTGPLTKALGRSSSEPTPADGKMVMEIEERVAKYRADLPSLKHALEKLKLEKAAVR